MRFRSVNSCEFFTGRVASKLGQAETQTVLESRRTKRHKMTHTCKQVKKETTTQTKRRDTWTYKVEKNNDLKGDAQQVQILTERNVLGKVFRGASYLEIHIKVDKQIQDVSLTESENCQIIPNKHVNKMT